MLKKLFVTVLMLGGLAANAGASPIYTCPGGSAQCEGQTFALYVVNTGAGFFDIAVSIDTTGYTGLETDLAYGVEFKNVTDQNAVYSGVSLLSAPGGIGNWNAFTGQVQKCDAPDTKADDACAGWAGAGEGYNFAIGDVLTWVFHVTSANPVLPGLGHIKYQYVDSDGKQVAGLLSEDIGIQTCIDGRCDVTVPEPGVLALFGAGLFGVAARLRRRTSAR